MAIAASARSPRESLLSGFLLQQPGQLGVQIVGSRRLVTMLGEAQRVVQLGRGRDQIGMRPGGVPFRGAASRPGGRPQVRRVPGAARPQRWDSPGRSADGAPVHWNRREVAECLRDEVRRGTRLLAGIDHGFSLPVAHFGRHQLDAWPDFLNEFTAQWPTHQERVSVNKVWRHQVRQRNSPWAPRQRKDPVEVQRLTERWTAAPRGMLLFEAPGPAAKAAHAGIPWLKWLRDEVGERLHFWPFDGWELPADKAVIVEVHPAIFRRRYGPEQREAVGQDAYATARWMADMAGRSALAACFNPPLTPMERHLAELEGWMLGVR